MDFEIRADGVLHIEGYVNAVERDSRIVMCPECGKCVEQIAAGAFGNALRAAKNVDMLLNHDKGRKIGSTSEGTLTLTEDSIGLRASADITDEEVVEKARNGLLRGWSFGFKATDTEIEQRSQGVPRRHVKALSISEVSLVDSRYRPCYAGTSIELRADEEGAEEADFTELRFNPYHNPTNGRFTTANGGGSGSGFLYSKGGKSAYVFERDIDGEYEQWKTSRSGAKKELDKAKISKANAQGSNFYDAGSAIARTYDREYDEIGTLNLSDDEKNAARDKIYEYSAAELEARQKYFDVYTVGPARKVDDSDKAFDKSMNIAGEHSTYMNSLRDKSSKNTRRQNEKNFDEAFKAKVSKAAETGAREITVNGETYFRRTKSSGSWEKGTLRDDQAKRKFMKSQQNMFIADRKSWDSLSSDEKAKYYSRAEPDTPDYSSYEARIARVRMRELEQRAEELELRFNPYHDPQNGRFTTANGGGSGSGFLYSKGGKSAYVFERDIDSEYEAWTKSKAAKASHNADRNFKLDAFLREKHNNMTDANNVVSARDVEDYINYKIGMHNIWLSTNLSVGSKTYDRPAKIDFNLGKSIDIMVDNTPAAAKGIEEAFSDLKKAGFEVKKIPDSYYDKKFYNITRKKGTRTSVWEKDMPERFDHIKRRKEAYDWNSPTNWRSP